jgi:8-oxo-dGTP diphosphatase
MGVIEAAGGLVWRAGTDGNVEVLLVHRPFRDDWTLPIGRREPGETLEACALREVAEETGYRCRLGPLLDTLTVDADDGIHRFHIYEMAPIAGGFVPNAETDEAVWLPVEEAIARATYPNVRALLAEAAGGLRSSAGGAGRRWRPVRRKG